MNSEMPTRLSTALNLTAVVDRASERFESAWKSGGRPQIEQFLEGVEEPGRSLLLRELLIWELERRAGVRDAANVDDYRKRFPEHGDLIDEVFDLTRTSTQRTTSPAAPAPDDDPAPGAEAESSRFRILRSHAHGGLGVVFVARDRELPREVALKEIQNALADNPGCRVRFLREAEITGALEHPGIVPVYGLGVYDNGRPYYAMRLIRGDTLKDVIAAFHADPNLRANPGQRSLELLKLVRRFLDVCNAIDYAHSRGVLHRDIKPGNVIVGKYGETLVVDWGLAKSLGESDPEGLWSGDLTHSSNPEATISETQSGPGLGTPAFMSPEQAAGEIDGLGPRSDVYSLGATLYYLLTGHAPFKGDEIADVLDAVQHGELVAPRRVDRSIAPALEAICLKALARDAEARYTSPRDLAEDVERWAAGEPVSAWREPIVERVRRWARRNRTAVAAAGAAALMAVAGLVAVLGVQARANHSLKEKNVQLTAANARAEERFALAEAAIKTFHTGLSENVLLKDDKFADLRNKLLREAATFYGKLEGMLQAETDRTSRSTLGKAYDELAALTAKIGSKPESLAVYRRALVVRQSLADANPSTPEFQSDLARDFHNVGILLSETGQRDDALRSLETGRKIQQQLVDAHPTDSDFRYDLAVTDNDLGLLLGQTGRPDDALRSYERARVTEQVLVDADPAPARFLNQLAETYNNIGVLQIQTGRRADALPTFEQAKTIRQRLADTDPSVPEYQYGLAVSYNNIGNLQREAGHAIEALQSYSQARDIQQKLVQKNPAITEFLNYLAESHNNIGVLEIQTGHREDALRSFEQAKEIRQRLSDANPMVNDFPYGLAVSLINIGNLQRETGHPDAALQSYLQALEIRERLAAADPTVSNYQLSLSESYNNIGVLQSGMGRLDEARRSYEKALEIRQRLANANPAVSDFQYGLAESHSNLGKLLSQSGHPADALQAYRRALAIQERLVATNPTVNEFRVQLAGTYVNIANAQVQTKELSEALASLETALAAREKLASVLPGDFLYAAALLARISALAGPGEKSANAANQAVARLRQAIAKGFRDVSRLETDPDLASIRARPDFQSLLRDLTAPSVPAPK